MNVHVSMRRPMFASISEEQTTTLGEPAPETADRQTEGEGEREGEGEGEGGGGGEGEGGREGEGEEGESVGKTEMKAVDEKRGEGLPMEFVGEEGEGGGGGERDGDGNREEEAMTEEASSGGGGEREGVSGDTREGEEGERPPITGGGGTGAPKPPPAISDAELEQSIAEFEILEHPVLDDEDIPRFKPLPPITSSNTTQQQGVHICTYL